MTGMKKNILANPTVKTKPKYHRDLFLYPAIFQYVVLNSTGFYMIGTPAMKELINLLSLNFVTKKRKKKLRRKK